MLSVAELKFVLQHARRTKLHKASTQLDLTFMFLMAAQASSTLVTFMYTVFPGNCEQEIIIGIIILRLLATMTLI